MCDPLNPTACKLHQPGTLFYFFVKFVLRLWKSFIFVACSKYYICLGHPKSKFHRDLGELSVTNVNPWLYKYICVSITSGSIWHRCSLKDILIYGFGPLTTGEDGPLLASNLTDVPVPADKKHLYHEAATTVDEYGWFVRVISRISSEHAVQILVSDKTSRLNFPQISSSHHASIKSCFVFWDCPFTSSPIWALDLFHYFNWPLVVVTPKPTPQRNVLTCSLTRWLRGCLCCSIFHSFNVQNFSIVIFFN